VDPAALGLQPSNGQTASATDLQGWECKMPVPMTLQPDRAVGTLTLIIPWHDFRMIPIARRSARSEPSRTTMRRRNDKLDGTAEPRPVKGRRDHVVKNIPSMVGVTGPFETL